MSKSRDLKLADRPGYREENAQSNAMAADLGKFCTEHKLLGAVLISFTEERYAANHSGFNDIFLAVMGRLADRVLGDIDDGRYDPEEGGVLAPAELAIKARLEVFRDALDSIPMPKAGR